VLERVAEVVRSGRYVLGPEVEAFESELGSFLGVRHVIGVANGTDALTIAFRALGVGQGDEVVVPSFTFYATAEAVVTAGAMPVFCDVDRATRNVSVETVGAVLTPRTAAIVAVDLSAAAASAYLEAGLSEHAGVPAVPQGAEPAWHLYVVEHPDPDLLAAALQHAGVQTRGYYRTPVHRQPPMASYAAAVELPVTDELARTNLALPMSPALGADQARRVVAAIAAARG